MSRSKQPLLSNGDRAESQGSKLEETKKIFDSPLRNGKRFARVDNVAQESKKC